MPIRLKPQRSAPQRRLCERTAFGTQQAVGPIHVKQSRPAERPQHLDIEAAQNVVEVSLQIGLTEQHAAEVGPCRTVLGFDVQDV